MDRKRLRLLLTAVILMLAILLGMELSASRGESQSAAHPTSAQTEAPDAPPAPTQAQPADSDMPSAATQDTTATDPSESTEAESTTGSTEADSASDSTLPPNMLPII